MSLADELEGIRTVFIDTAPIIYYIEAHTQYAPVVEIIADMIRSKRITAFSSVITLAEVMPKPIENGKEFLANRFSSFLQNTRNIFLLEITAKIAESAGRLRGRNPSLRAMDAIQIATSIESQSQAFITNDVKLKKIPDLKVILLKDYV